MTNKNPFDKYTTPEQLKKLKEFFPEEYKDIVDKKHVNITLKKFITNYPLMNKLKEDIRLLSEVNDSVLLIGPTGTGKELLARALHGDREGPFVGINCAGLPEHLVESELFGYKKGSFTGAISEKIGLLQSAYKGTVFFDEIGELPLSTQAKLLRALEEKYTMKVGAGGDERDDISTVRFVAATHRHIREEMIPSYKFREDLYWRIARFELEVVGLNERTGDIPLIVKQLIINDKDIINHDIEDIGEFCEEIIRNRDKLTGNVRQLQKIVRNYHVLGKLPRFV